MFPDVKAQGCGSTLPNSVIRVLQSGDQKLDRAGILNFAQLPDRTLPNGIVRILQLVDRLPHVISLPMRRRRKPEQAETHQ